MKYADAHETLIYWDIYVCWTGVVSGAYSSFLKNSELRTYGMYGQQITTLSMKARSTTSLRFSSLRANCWAIASRLCHFNFGGTLLVGWLATCFQISSGLVLLSDLCIVQRSGLSYYLCYSMETWRLELLSGLNLHCIIENLLKEKCFALFCYQLIMAVYVQLSMDRKP